MTLRAGALLGVFCVQACFAAGCQAQAKIESRTVGVPPAKEQELIASFHERALDSIDDKELLEHLEKAMATKEPFLFIAAMSRACDWVRYGTGEAEKRDERMAKVAPLVDRCLSSKEPFERLTGAMALLVLEENARLEKELARDSTFLLVRPEPEPGVDIFSAPTPGEARDVTEKRFRALMAVSAVADTRNRVIEMCGRLKVGAAKKHLEAIAADSHGQLVKQTAEAARTALAVLENRKTPSESPGLESVPYVPDERPELVLPNEVAAMIEISVAPLTAEQERIAQQLLKQFRNDSAIVSDIEDGIRSGHPYLMICALEAAGRWSYGSSRPDRDGAKQASALRPYIERSLSSQRPLERMAGAIALLELEEVGRFRDECDKDSSFLLIRPVSLSSSEAKGETTNRRGARKAINPRKEIEFYQFRLISTAGRLRITSTRHNLQSVLHDARDRKDPGAVYKATKALRCLDGSE
ncbi:MAG TPA: hypothetical protein VJZ71_05370 [Phycisphaerae bacterium]|nr:hypothetical protein [Phycisphaerae bacterium]